MMQFSKKPWQNIFKKSGIKYIYVLKFTIFLPTYQNTVQATAQNNTNFHIIYKVNTESLNEIISLE